MLAHVLALLPLAHALPFITTWNTTQPNEAIVLPPISFTSNSLPTLVEWGDSTSEFVAPTGLCADIVLNHTYATPGLYNVSINDTIFWTGYEASLRANATTKTKLVDIVSWGDVFWIKHGSIGLFYGYVNLQVSAPPDSQPMFWGSQISLQHMFSYTRFNSPLNWNITSVVGLREMFSYTPLNQPITFRNTHRVQTISGLFFFATKFNQPFHFDASEVTDASSLFWGASSFNQVVNLTNSTILSDVENMFSAASSFNQPIFMNTDSVTNMNMMFWQASKFNQPVTFNTSKVRVMSEMFSGALAFNQPIDLNVPELRSAFAMFFSAKSFNQPVVMNTSAKFVDALSMFADATSFASSVTLISTANVTNMRSMFSGATGFTQDLSSWDTRAVTSCGSFCLSCGLPSFPLCTPCATIYTNPLTNISTCSDGKGTTTTTSSTDPSSPTWVLVSSLVLAFVSGISIP